MTQGRLCQLSAVLGFSKSTIRNEETETAGEHPKARQGDTESLADPEHVACRLYSLVLSCKQAGMDPEAYIEDVLGRVSTTKASEIAALTPCAWAAARR